jgi:hypothetical protein
MNQIIQEMDVVPSLFFGVNFEILVIDLASPSIFSSVPLGESLSEIIGNVGCIKLLGISLIALG